MATKDPDVRQAPRRAQANGSTRRAELLAIAAELFATRGFTQTTVRDIADEAGILSGSLYHHFSSKEAMLTEILREFMDGLLSRFTGIVEEGESPGEIFDGLVRASFDTIHDQLHAVALYQNESAFLTSSPDFDFVAKSSREVEKLWIGVLEAGRSSGEFRPGIDPKLAYRFIRDAVWSAVRWYHPGGRLGHRKVADSCLALLHDGLLAR